MVNIFNTNRVFRRDNAWEQSGRGPGGDNFKKNLMLRAVGRNPPSSNFLIFLAEELIKT
jgi:hypothetical protein